MEVTNSALFFLKKISTVRIEKDIRSNNIINTLFVVATLTFCSILSWRWMNQLGLIRCCFGLKTPFFIPPSQRNEKAKQKKALNGRITCFPLFRIWHALFGPNISFSRVLAMFFLCIRDIEEETSPLPPSPMRPFRDRSNLRIPTSRVSLSVPTSTKKRKREGVLPFSPSSRGRGIAKFRLLEVSCRFTSIYVLKQPWVHDHKK